MQFECAILPYDDAFIFIASTEGKQMLLGEMLRLALERRLPGGWVYLPAVEEFRLDTPCLLIIDEFPEEDVNRTPLEAIRQGFPTMGLDVATIEDTAQWNP